MNLSEIVNVLSGRKRDARRVRRKRHYDRKL